MTPGPGSPLAPTAPSEDPLVTTPLGSVRIIECSMLGPGAITTTLADLGADVIKVEPPSGDYIREMTWPIVEGTSLMHLHISRGQALHHDRPAHRGGPRGLPRAREGRRRGDRGHATRRAGAARRRLRGVQGREPPHRVLHDLGLRHDRPVQGHAQPRHRLRRVGRARAAGHHRRRLLRHPRAPVGRHPRRPALRCPRRCWPASPGPGPRASRASSRSPSPTPPRPWTGSAARRTRPTSDPESEVTGNKADGYERRAAGHGGHARRRALPVLRDRRRAHPVHGLRAGVLGELLQGHRSARALRAPPRLEVRRPRTGQRGAATRAGRDLPQPHHGRVGGAGRRGQHADRSGEHAQDAGRRPAVPGPPPVDPQGAGRQRPGALVRSRSSARSCPLPTKAPTAGEHTDVVLRDVLGSTTSASPPCAPQGPWADGGGQPARWTAVDGADSQL